jgi:hypothetical protein
MTLTARHQTVTKSPIRSFTVNQGLRKFSQNFFQDEGISGSTRGDIVLEKCGSNLFWLSVKEAAAILRPIAIEVAVAERRGSSIADVLPCLGRLFAHYRAVAAAARPECMTEAVASRLVDRLEWRSRKYYEMPLLVLAHVMDPTRKGVGLKTGCDDAVSWTSLIECVFHYGHRFGYDVGSSSDNMAGQQTTRSFMEYIAADVISEERAANGGRILLWSTYLTAVKAFRLLGCT